MARIKPAHLRRSFLAGSPADSKAEEQSPAVLVVDSCNPFTRLICDMLAPSGFEVLGAKSPTEALTLFQAHQPRIQLAVVDLVKPSAGNLDLTADLERLQPGLPVLYLVGPVKTIARCSIEAHAPGSVLAVPFTEEQFIGRVVNLLNLQTASRQRPGERPWQRVIDTSGGMVLNTEPW